MADTIRTIAALQTLLADNVSGDISAQDVRDFLVSTYRPQIANGFRLTTESGVPISTSDRTAQGTIYLTPYAHNCIGLYDGSSWRLSTSAEVSLALTATSGKNYDVFGYDNAGTLTLELSAAWTDDTTRADALTTQDGVYVKSGATTRRWLGTIRASGANVTADSAGGSSSQVGGTRFVWNAYNQVRRYLAVIDTTNSWSYTTDTWRQANAAAGNKVEYITGAAELTVVANIYGQVNLQANSAVGAKVGVGVDSTSAASGLRQMAYTTIAAPASLDSPVAAGYQGQPGLGYHYLAWLEKGADILCIFTGDNGGDGRQTGLYATIAG